MVLEQEDVKKIIDFVKKEPVTVQDISRYIGRSWVTTDSYLQKIKERTGLIDIKTFRKGTQAALKIVFYSGSGASSFDEVKDVLFQEVRAGRIKQDFDFMDIYQFVPNKKKRAFTEEYLNEENSKNPQIISLFRQEKNTIYCFSGNLSFINMKEKNQSILQVMEELAKKKIMFKIICRVNLASISNLSKISKLNAKYPDCFEVRHCHQPLRGFIIDDKIARFKDEEEQKKYKKGELHKNTRIVYEVFDDEWVSWLQKVFWNLFRTSLDYQSRVKELKKLF